MKRGRPPKNQAAPTITESPAPHHLKDLGIHEDAITDAQVEAIEARCFVKANAWGIVSPKRVIAAVLNEMGKA